LKNAGINLLSDSQKTRVKVHLKGSHWAPISNDLLEILDGELLGDGNIQSMHDRMGIKWHKSLPNYMNALDTLFLLQFLYEIDSDTVIKEFNEANSIISGSQTAYFRLHKSLEEKPWVRFIGQIFQSRGHSVSISDSKGTIHLHTQGTVQLYKLFQRWYKNAKKKVPSDLKLTPRVVLHWFIGDGGTGKRRIVLYSLSFSKEENELLADLLNKEIGISVTVAPRKNPRQPDRSYYLLDITGRRNYRSFLDYLELAPAYSLNLAKQLFPWKFSTDIRKKDVIANRLLLSAKNRIITRSNEPFSPS
jgi:hypothetical protein